MAGTRPQLRVEVPGTDYHRELIACQQACPVRTDARGYVRAVADGALEDAYLIARGPNPFASICGRVCGAPCEAACRRGRVPRTDADGRFVATDRPVAIRALKRLACERHGAEARPASAVLDALRAHVPAVVADVDEFAVMVQSLVLGRFAPADGERVAVIGAGPAGLAAAHDLVLLGLRPVVFESEPVPAGMLAFGIPEYRLPRELIRREIAVIEALGVDIRCNTTVGEAISFAELRRSFAAILIAVGAKTSRRLGLAGERGPGVMGGVDVLRAAALGDPLDLGARVLVVGGGNVAYDVARTVVRQAALDAARTALRLATTRQVTLAALEPLEEMPADTVEIVEGDEEGVERLNGWGPLEIRRDADGRVTGVEFRRCTRVYDDEGRFAPVFDDAVRRVVECDTVLLAVGQQPGLSFLEDGGDDIEELRPGWPRVDPGTLATSAPGIFVAGDLAHGTRLLIDAVASGKRAARSIYTHLTGRPLAADAVTAHLGLPGYRRERGYESIRRVPVPNRPVAERLADPTLPVEIGYGVEDGRREASRCLDCGVTPVFDGTRCVLCGGCVDVCPTLCLRIESVDRLAPSPELARLIDAAHGVAAAAGGGSDRASSELSAIIKDEDRCIRCALCVERCPADAIAMERVGLDTHWRTP